MSSSVTGSGGAFAGASRSRVFWATTYFFFQPDKVPCATCILRLAALTPRSSASFTASNFFASLNFLFTRRRLGSCSSSSLSSHVLAISNDSATPLGLLGATGGAGAAGAAIVADLGTDTFIT